MSAVSPASSARPASPAERDDKTPAIRFGVVGAGFIARWFLLSLIHI